MSIASSDIVLASGASSALATGTVTPEQIALIKNTILKPKDREATNEELALFIGQCQRTGLDPFARQIYGIFRKERGKEKMTIQTGIDGFRLVAQRAGGYGGQDGPFWRDNDGRWHESWTKAQGIPVAAKVIVRKVIGGMVVETPAVANFEEFAPRYNGALQGLWPQMPAHMNAKCAEALGLRKAFPQELSVIYTSDDMEHVDLDEPVIVAREIVAPPEPAVSEADVEELKAAAAGLPMGKIRLIFGAYGLDADSTPWEQIPKSKAPDLCGALSGAERPEA